MKTLERTQERVRNFVNQHSRAIFTLLVFFMLLGTAQVVEAQSGLKISSLSEVTDKAKWASIFWQPFWVLPWSLSFIRWLPTTLMPRNTCWGGSLP